VTNQPLPAYDRPPVSETVLGIEFEPLRGWGIPHFGLFWNEIRADYPKFVVQPPLASQIERFGTDARVPALTVEFGDPGRARCWFFHENDVHLLQVQDSRFLLNWRKLSSDTTYPHYSEFRPHFEREWLRFREFVRGADLGPLTVVQCEVSYVNFLPRGEGWNEHSDLHKVISAWSGKSAWLPAPESVALSSRYVLPEEQGRLHFALQPVVRNTDAKEGVQLTLTARGAPRSTDVQGILNFFDLGHEWIVRGFTDLTAAHMHKIWGRTV